MQNFESSNGFLLPTWAISKDLHSGRAYRRRSDFLPCPRQLGRSAPPVNRPTSASSIDPLLGAVHPAATSNRRVYNSYNLTSRSVPPELDPVTSPAQVMICPSPPPEIGVTSTSTHSMTRGPTRGRGDYAVDDGVDGAWMSPATSPARRRTDALGHARQHLPADRRHHRRHVEHDHDVRGRRPARSTMRRPSTPSNGTGTPGLRRGWADYNSEILHRRGEAAAYHHIIRRAHQLHQQQRGVLVPPRRRQLHASPTARSASSSRP